MDEARGLLCISRPSTWFLGHVRAHSFNTRARTLFVTNNTLQNESCMNFDGIPLKKNQNNDSHKHPLSQCLRAIKD